MVSKALNLGRSGMGVAPTDRKHSWERSPNTPLTTILEAMQSQTQQFHKWTRRIDSAWKADNAIHFESRKPVAMKHSSFINAYILKRMAQSSHDHCIPFGASVGLKILTTMPTCHPVASYFMHITDAVISAANLRQQMKLPLWTKMKKFRIF